VRVAEQPEPIEGEQVFSLEAVHEETATRREQDGRNKSKDQIAACCQLERAEVVDATNMIAQNAPAAAAQAIPPLDKEFMRPAVAPDAP
jgi:hypothetical protein